MKQGGFTLLELMVAMAIFAMLAVAGWQVFDGVTRARERAQYHADQLAVLQYAYLQLQQDMAQIVPYQAPPSQNGSDSIHNSTASTNDINPTNTDKTASTITPFLSLSPESMSFIRFADPDPRYQSSPTLQRIEYLFADQRLIRRQYHDIQGSTQSISLDSILLNGVTATSWHAYLPEISATFPNKDGSNDSRLEPSADSTMNKDDRILLPKGIGVSFTYQDNPISWQWAMSAQSTAYQRQNNKSRNTSTNQPTDNNGNNDNHDDNNSDFDIDSNNSNDIVVN